MNYLYWINYVIRCFYWNDIFIDIYPNFTDRAGFKTLKLIQFFNCTHFDIKMKMFFPKYKMKLQ